MRKAAALSLEDVARVMGVTKVAVYVWSRAFANLPSLARLWRHND